MSDQACVLCNHSTNDALQLGEKSTFEGTTAHLYCLLLTSNLVQNGEDDEGISGFMPKDIKAEVQRTKKLFCWYCREKSATIGCCVKSCRRSFHLPCALQNNCRLEFTNTFRSFCEVHHDLKQPKTIHKATDLCTICYDEMGEYNLIRSIPLSCCNKNAWCHKLCLQKYAQTSGYFLKCPLCNDSNKFRDFIAQRGVFIPDRDAKWEIDGTGPNTFYGFEQHNERPSKCIAKVCKCPKGREYQVDVENDKYSLEFCQYCGSHAVHLGCMNTKEFRCDDCASILDRSQASAASLTASDSDRESFKTTNSQLATQRSWETGMRSSTSSTSDATDTENEIGARFGQFSGHMQNLAKKFNLRECSIRLTRLNSKDFTLKCETSDSEHETTDGNANDTVSTDQTAVEGSSSDEKEIEPILRKTKKPIVIFDSDTDNEINIMPDRSLIAFSDIGREEKEHQFDINDNSRDVTSSNLNVNNGTVKTENILKIDQPTKSTANGLCMQQFSSSDEDQVKPIGLNSHLRRLATIESSDDQIIGKENEKPLKSIAIVRPFTNTSASSSDEIIRPAKIRPRPRPRILSSDEISDDSFRSFVSPRNDCSNSVDSPSYGIKTEAGMPFVSEISPKIYSPSKKKRRTVRSYFSGISSSDDEAVEPKRRRKSPKKSRPRSMQNGERQPNQASIMHFFSRQINQSI